jgi:sigma-B regulation protein RsbU (phosphoserine phosphatase)
VGNTDVPSGHAGEALYEHAPCGLLVTDDDGLVLRANATFCDWLGVGADALVGKRRFQDLLTVGGRIFHQTQWAPLLRMQGSVAEVKLDLVRPGQPPIPMVMNVIRRERGAATVHELALFIATDRHAYERELLAARKRAEELLSEQRAAREAQALAETRLRMALDAGSLYVWELDVATMERRFDPGVALLLGRAQAGPVDFREYFDAVDPGDREPARQALEWMLAHPGETYRQSYRVNGADGVQRTVLAIGRALPSDDGAARVVGVLQDISDLTAQHAAAEDRALFAEQMVGIVSHDLRNPLATIRTASDVLKMVGVPERARSILGNLERATNRALRMINDLLDFTRTRLGQGIALSRRTIDLHGLVAEHLAELSLANPRARLEHRRVGDGACSADPDRLVQLVGNLVSNAITYGTSGTPVVVTTTTDAAGFSISVCNEGEPIPVDLQPTLFQPMVRGAETGTDKRSVGLGLYIVAEVARAHGGNVRLESGDTGRTEFVASFPRADRPGL